MTTPVIVGMTTFARSRHTPTSAYSHWSGSEAELCRLVEEHWGNAKAGRANGCMEVCVPAEGFFTGITQVTTATVLKAVFAARHPSEAPYLQFRAVGGEKMAARSVIIILYTKAECGPHADPNGPEWQIASINATTMEGREPAHPMAMARNMMGLAGGSAATYTAQELAEAIIYWSDKCPIEPVELPK